jgi:multiple sugar transport system permease protein
VSTSAETLPRIKPLNSSGCRRWFRKELLAASLILPAAAVVFAAMLIPLVYALWMSLFNYRIGGETKGAFIFFGNYLRFFQDPEAILSLGITLVFTFGAVIAEIVLGIGIAILLRSVPNRIGKVLRGLYCMPLLISPIIVGLIWRYMYDPTYGLAYYLLGLFGLSNAFGGLQEPSSAIFCVMLADIWETTPFVLLCATAGLANIPSDLYEASTIDGASAGQRLLYITLPMLRKVIAVVLIIRGTDAFRVFDLIYALTGGGPANSTLSLSIYAFKKGFVENQMGYAMAIAIITMIILIALFGPLMKALYART